MKELSKRQLQKQKEKSLEIIDKMIGELQHTRTAIEYDKKAKPYFYMINFMEDDRLGTHTLGNMDMFTTIGILESFKISNIIRSK